MAEARAVGAVGAVGVAGVVLDAELQRQLARLRLQLRLALHPQHRGAHEAPGRGRSHTFVEHRPYAAGDELRHVDWRASARRGRMQSKVFGREARATLELVLDATASMGYAGDAQGERGDASAKWDAARVLCYALATVALREGDAVGLSVWQTGPRRLLPASAHPAQRRRLLVALATLVPAGNGSAAWVPALLAGPPTRRRAVVVSDFLTEAGRSVAALTTLSRRGVGVDAVHLVHPDEAALPFRGRQVVVDLEGATPFAIDGDAQRQAFAARAATFADRLSRELRAGGARYVPQQVGTPLGQALRRLASEPTRGAGAARQRG